MGQFSSKEKKHRHVKKIIDKVFDKFTAANGEEKLTFQELYTAVLLVYNDINKYLPGPYHDPPKREVVQSMLKEFDVNENGVLDREEFAAFLDKFTHNLSSGVTKGLLIYAAAPLLAMTAKMATEQLPRVGPVVRRIPNFVYSMLVTTAVAIFHSQKAIDE